MQFDYTWTAGQPVAPHVHTTDAIAVFVNGASLKRTLADGSVDVQPVAFKNAPIVPRGRVDSEEAVSGSPRAIVIELK